ncbi:MAG TPA: DNA-binding response regulator [Rhodospirillaceae bacterium]|nr:MAG: DNA-binding response regulator [Alphaproteobacteria bacterium GWF2_58_20]HAU28779.1 DNA-binding response regulator [Rhodospirillaceae bacterium]
MIQNPPAHIMVVDDDDRLRALLCRYLAENGYVVASAADAAEARRRMLDFQFDALIVDIMMPGEDGLSLTRSLRNESNVPILLLTARGAPDDRISGLEAGADDYLGKPFEPRELLLRIEAILRRARRAETVSGALIGGFRFDAQKGVLLGPEGEREVLPAAESALLSALVGAAGTPVSRDSLVDILGGGMNVRSIDVLVARLRKKLGDDPRNPVHIKTVRGEGYVLWAA